MNRNHFDRPIQGNGRDIWDYGRTGIQEDPPAERVVVALAIMAFMVLGALLYWVLSGGRV